jgi:two-component system, NtrC family, response regulator GlrR
MTAARSDPCRSAAALVRGCGDAAAEMAHDCQTLHLQLRALVEDASIVDRTRRLMSSVGNCGPESPHPFAITTQPGDGSPRPPPLGVVLLTDAAHVSACCASLSDVRSVWPGVPTVVLAQDLPEELLARLLACGPLDFCLLSGSDSEIRLRLRRALGQLPPADPPAQPALPADLSLRLIGSAPSFVRLVRRVPIMAGSTASVLLLGETGTGKEVFAQAIHYCSSRARGPWVAINCAAIPSELVESELFGHTRGAYTHAVAARDGLVQEAECGTLFLDEIDSMPLAAQAKLLRFLQDKEYRMVGSSQRRTANVRVIAASNRDLRRSAAAGTFRQDLFFRLNVLNLTLPPLRDRREDIPALSRHFLDQANRECGRHLGGLTLGALSSLLAYDWPGNVRELKHVLQRAVLLAQGSTLQVCDIELDDGQPSDAASEQPGVPISFREAKARAVDAFEKHYLEQLLVQSHGNITQAARAARKNRRAFFELLRRHSIDAEHFRSLN